MSIIGEQKQLDSYPIFEEYPEIVAGSSTKLSPFHSESPRSEMVQWLCGDLPFAVPVQVHSANVKWIEAGGHYSDCDGLLSRSKNLALTLRTADCIPLFLYAPDIETIGLIHIGWRGFHQGIVNVTAELLRKAGADFSKMAVAMGASICGECYEIQNDLVDLFPNEIKSRNGKKYLDLPHLVEKALQAKGIQKIERSRFCTYHNYERYHSYRQDKTEERMISVMMRNA